MKATIFSALADRLERAERTDPDLDSDIYEALGYEVIRRPRSPRGVAWRYRGRGPLDQYGHSHWQTQGRLTFSVDDAYRHIARPLWGDAEIVLSMRTNRSKASSVLPVGRVAIQSEASTPALALCALTMRLMGHRAETPLASDELASARHALGLSDDRDHSYRNRYYTRPDTADGMIWERLVGRGLAVKSEAASPVGVNYGLTFEGAIRALQPGESLCGEDFPR